MNPTQLELDAAEHGLARQALADFIAHKPMKLRAERSDLASVPFFD